MEKVRNSSIELLRIIAMIMIVASHYSFHNGLDFTKMNLGFNRFFLEANMLGSIGVIIFVLITGYFSIDTKEIKYKKIIKLYLEILFYNVVIYTVLLLLKVIDFNFITFIKVFFPIIFKQYWFMSAYVILSFFIPYLNRFLKTLNKNEYYKFLSISSILFLLIPFFTGQKLFCNELFLFILFYSLGGYLRKYPDNAISTYKNKICLFTTIILFVSIVLLDSIGMYFPILRGGGEHSTYLFEITSPIAVLFSSSLFCIFSNFKIDLKFINTISSATLGVYLIHENPYIRNILWKQIFNATNYSDSNFLIFHLIFSVLIVYCVCTIIELLRKKIVLLLKLNEF